MGFWEVAKEVGLSIAESFLDSVEGELRDKSRNTKFPEEMRGQYGDMSALVGKAKNKVSGLKDKASESSPDSMALCDSEFDLETREMDEADERIKEEEMWKEIAELYMKAAEEEDSEAQNELGCAYLDGMDGLDVNYEKAVKWFQRSMKRGNAQARNNMASCYRFGWGVEQDTKKAVEWHKELAEKGVAEAEYCLGICYRDGTEVEEDKKEAVKWWRKAAEQGLARAQYALGVYYANGIGVEEDKKEAVKWYRKAAEQGYEEGKEERGD